MPILWSVCKQTNQYNMRILWKYENTEPTQNKFMKWINDNLTFICSEGKQFFLWSERYFQMSYLTLLVTYARYQIGLRLVQVQTTIIACSRYELGGSSPLDLNGLCHTIFVIFLEVRVDLVLKSNSWKYNFVEVSGHNLESSQTCGFCI